MMVLLTDLALRFTVTWHIVPQVYRGMTDAARAIYKDQGFTGLYRGLGVTLVEIVPYAALQFGLYDAFNHMWNKAAAPHRRQQQQRGLNSSNNSNCSSSNHSSSSSSSAWWDDRNLQSFACGLAAGLLAKLGSHPLDVAKKRYQVAGLNRSLRYGARVERQLAVMPLLSCLGEIHAREGIAGLWKGSVPSIVKAAPAAAITFTAYEAFITFLLAWSRQNEQQQHQ
eukprot:GHUV01028494.1.p1 GENE.GHUV01028494.1~~GHUV01028494.1.p1  ORF type:complete len:225 (+),score=70.03 GHUV01028494.1:1129-1803(+)